MDGIKATLLLLLVSCAAGCSTFGHAVDDPRVEAAGRSLLDDMDPGSASAGGFLVTGIGLLAKVFFDARRNKGKVGQIWDELKRKQDKA